MDSPSLSSRRRHRTRSRASPSSHLRPVALALTLSLALLPCTTASTAPDSLPQVDWARMGSVALGGSFVGLDFYDRSRPVGVPAQEGAGSLVIRQPGGGGWRAGATDQGGRMDAACWIDYGGDGGSVFVGGNFTRVDGVNGTSTAARDAALLDVSSGAWTAVGGDAGPGVGAVRAVYCDEPGGRVWVGGENGAVVYTLSSGSVDPAPFGVLDGAVDAIAPGSDSIIFTGDFTTSFSASGNTTGNATASTSAAPAGTVGTGTSPYLTPISLANATISAGPSTIDPALAAFADPTVLACPADGQGWIVQDGIEGKIDVLIGGNGGVDVVGVRVGNLVKDGRGTTKFCLVTIPDNTLQVLTYTDPKNGSTLTCHSHCELSTDLAVTAQDYLFATPQSITGFQVYLSEWQGLSAGLSRLQALSVGAFASAVQGQNAGVCVGSAAVDGQRTNQTQVQTTGMWTERTVFTDIPASVLQVLVSTADTSSTDRPSVTYYPYVAASGYYEVYALIPGCTQMQDCGARTTVDVVVFPSAGSLGYTSTISQVVQADARVLVYSGYMQATTDAFRSTLQIALAENPTAPSSGSTWEIVAGDIQLEFTSTSVNGGATNGTAGSANATSANTTALSFGVFEWPVSATGLDVSKTLGNTSRTAVDALGLTLGRARGATASASSIRAAGWSVQAVATLSGSTYIGGNFSQAGNWSNVLGVDGTTGTVAPLANQGLNGIVYAAAAAAGKYLYFGGAFTNTQSASDSKLAYIARYDPSGKTWLALGGGVDGPVSAITPISNNASLLVSGNFSNVIAADGSYSSTGGIAIWNISSDANGGSWYTSGGGVVLGNVSQVASDSSGSTYLTGVIAGISANAAEGVAMLSGSGSSVSLDTVPVGFSSSAGTPQQSTVARRSLHKGGRRNGFNAIPRAFVNLVSEAFLGRRQASTPAITPPAIPRQIASAPAVLAGAYWTNSSASGKPTINILGGNFTKTSPAIQGLSFYDPKSKSVTGTNGQLSGVVHSLAVVGNEVYVGGNLSVGTAKGLALYDLEANAWQSGIPALSSDNANATVNAIVDRSSANSLIVAGNFTTAGSLACAAVCAWDTAATRWSALGSGLQSGEIRTVELTGNNNNVLVVAGSFLLADSTLAYVAQYSFENSTWQAIGNAGSGNGQIPGPATAMTVDNGNLNSIFVSGVSNADASPYFVHWDGQTWTTQNNTLATGSTVQQMVFVPLSNGHAATGSIEGDRMLMLSGDLDLGSTGSFSSALYDGQQWHPYLSSTSSSGSSGSVSSLFYSQHSFSFSARHFLAVGIIVLIALAISTGLIFLLVLIGILIALWRRRRARKQETATFARQHPASPAPVEGDTESVHQRRLGAIQQAIFGPTVIGGTGAAAAMAANEKHHSNASSFEDYEIAAAAGTEHHSDESDSPSHMGRPTQAKYDFVGEQEGELTVQMGDKLYVIEEHEDEQWSYVRNEEGKEGVVPASYIW